MCFASMYRCIACVFVPAKARRRPQTPGTVVLDGNLVDAGTKEDTVLLTVEPSLQGLESFQIKQISYWWQEDGNSKI